MMRPIRGERTGVPMLLRLMVAVVIGLAAMPGRGFAQDESADAAAAPTDRVRFGPFRMQDHRGFDNLVTVSPGLEWLASTGYGFNPEVVYHRALSDCMSLRTGLGVPFGASYHDPVAIIDVDGTPRIETADVRHAAVGPRLGLDWHPVGNGFHGFYLGPRLSYDRGWTWFRAENGRHADTHYDDIGVGGAVGWHWVWGGGFSFGLGLDVTYHAAFERAATGAAGSDTDTYLRVAPRIAFGWAF